MRNTQLYVLKPVLFTLAGALAGLAYYALAGCSAGSCPLTSTPVAAMTYMGFAGWLLSGIFSKGCDTGCNT